MIKLKLIQQKRKIITVIYTVFNRFLKRQVNFVKIKRKAKLSG